MKNKIAMVTKDREDEISLRLKNIKNEQIKDYYNLVSDDEYYTQTDINFLDEILELERLAEIGMATELAMQDGSKHTVFAKGIDYLLEFYYRESEVK